MPKNRNIYSNISRNQDTELSQFFLMLVNADENFVINEIGSNKVEIIIKEDPEEDRRARFFFENGNYKGITIE